MSVESSVTVPLRIGSAELGVGVWAQAANGHKGSFL